MAISPNDTFTVGQVLTAAEANAFPFGVVGFATSSADYTLTTSAAIATGMTVTFTAIANRYYKVTYYEPQVQTPNLTGGNTRTQIRLTNAAGALQNQTITQTGVASQINDTAVCFSVNTFSAGSVTIVGCAITSSTSGGPVLGRSAQPAILLVEDIGPA